MIITSKNFNPDWSEYYKAVAGRLPRKTLMIALSNFDAEAPLKAQYRFAVDLGCGEGRDTVELLKHGWHVLAIDDQPKAFEYLLSHSNLKNIHCLETHIAHFEETSWPETDLINASNSLPFCSPTLFPALWKKVVCSIRNNGRFSGQFFGEREALAKYTTITHHTSKQVKELFKNFEIEYFDETEQDKQTPFGHKHCHMFHVVAQKRSLGN